MRPEVVAKSRLLASDLVSARHKSQGPAYKYRFGRLVDGCVEQGSGLVSAS